MHTSVTSIQHYGGNAYVLRHPLVNCIEQTCNKLTPYGTDGRLFTIDVSVKFKVT